MLIRPRTIICACGVGPDLHLAVIEASALGVRAQTGPVIKDVLHAQPDALRRAGASLPRAGSLVFVCPAELTAVRPIGVGVSGFLSARSDLHKSLGRLVPITPENALIGLVERHAAESGDAGTSGGTDAAGYLFAARRDAIDTWIEKLRTITGRGPDAVLAPAMALIGIGGQRTETFVALERSISGGLFAHTLRFGRAADLAHRIDSERLASIRSSGAIIRSLPSAGETSASSEGLPISPAELAIAGGMAMIMGGGEFAPLTGAPPRTAPQWAAGVAALIGAGVIVWAALGLRGYRYERAIEHLAREEQTLDAGVAQVQAMRAESARLAALVRDGVGAASAKWSPRMPDLAAAVSIMPTGAFLYNISASNTGITIQGEAPKASAVLAALESSPRFANAIQQDPTIAIPEYATESFGLRAGYEKPQASPPVQEGAPR